MTTNSDLITKQECLTKWNGTVPTIQETTLVPPALEPYHMTSVQGGFTVFLILLCLALDILFIKEAVRLKRRASTSGALPMMYSLIFCVSCMGASQIAIAIMYW